MYYFNYCTTTSFNFTHHHSDFIVASYMGMTNVPISRTTPNQLCVRDNHTASSEEGVERSPMSSIQERDVPSPPPLPLIKECTPPASVLIEEVSLTAIGSPDLEIFIRGSARAKGGNVEEEGVTTSLTPVAISMIEEAERPISTSGDGAADIISTTAAYNSNSHSITKQPYMPSPSSMQCKNSASATLRVVKEEGLNNSPVSAAEEVVSAPMKFSTGDDLKEDEKEPLEMIGAPDIKISTEADKGYRIVTSPINKKEDSSNHQSQSSSSYTSEERKKWVSERMNGFVIKAIAFFIYI